jgi:hypothetical protein
LIHKVDTHASSAGRLERLFKIFIIVSPSYPSLLPDTLKCKIRTPLSMIHKLSKVLRFFKEDKNG